MAVLSHADFHEGSVTVSNIRNCSYAAADVFVVDHYDKTFKLADLESLDFIVVPFKATPSLAHTMISFGFRDGQHLVVSVEVRLEVGETYSPILGAMRQYEIMYVVGDERDLIKLRAHHRGDDVYVYRVRTTPEQLRGLFVDVMRRVNELENKPEFYDTITNNCTNNIVRHVNRLNPGRIPLDVRIMLPGLADRMAYDLGLLDTDLSFEQTKRAARVEITADQSWDATDFSRLIRR